MNLLLIPSRLADKFLNQARLLTKAVSAMIVRTNISRWREVSKNANPQWDGRNETLAKLIPAGSSVIDLGCGAQTLRRYLDSSCTYQPCDVIQSTPDVIFCNFNSGVYPKVTQIYDYVVCSGVFEYIRNPAEFLRKNAELGRIMLLTYNPLHQILGDSKIRRLNCDWVNHFTRSEIEILFDQQGLIWKNLDVNPKSGELIYSLRVRD